MAKKKQNILPRFEVLIIIVFFLSFVAWAFKQCADSKLLLEEENTDPTEEVTTEDTVAITPTPPINPIDTTPLPLRQAVPQEPQLSRLYITIDGLKMRKTPDLKSDVILTLKLFEEVGYMNEYTDSTYQISLGYEIADEPWVKVKHKNGRVGWVYGAGVDYRKKKRKGVME